MITLRIATYMTLVALTMPWVVTMPLWAIALRPVDIGFLVPTIAALSMNIVGLIIVNTILLGWVHQFDSYFGFSHPNDRG